MLAKSHSYEVLGLGAACIDLLIPVTEAFLTTIPGEKGGAQPVTLETLNQIIQASGAMPHVSAGGSCSNTIKGLTHLGSSCALISQIGTDAFGQYLDHHLSQIGITPLFLKFPEPTMRILCLITPDGQRTMRFFEGCTAENLESYILPVYFEGVKIVHIEAYFLRHGYVVEKVVKLAKEAHILVSIDLSSFEIVHTYRDRIYYLLSCGIDIVFANKDEIQALLGLPPHEACLQLQSLCRTSVVLMGKEGCLVGHQQKVIHVPTLPATVLDTTGAGDLFASGFLYGYLNDYSLEACAQLGNQLGRTVIGVVGTEIPEEKWQEIRENLKN